MPVVTEQPCGAGPGRLSPGAEAQLEPRAHPARGRGGVLGGQLFLSFRAAVCPVPRAHLGTGRSSVQLDFLEASRPSPSPGAASPLHGSVAIVPFRVTLSSPWGSGCGRAPSLPSSLQWPPPALSPSSTAAQWGVCVALCAPSTLCVTLVFRHWPGDCGWAGWRHITAWCGHAETEDAFAGTVCTRLLSWALAGMLGFAEHMW